MSENHAAVPTKMLGVVLAAAFAVVVWRATALVIVYLQPNSSDEALVIKTLLAVVGITFLVCGLLVFWKLPSKASLLFVGFCISSGLHWGGPLDLPPGQLRTGLILFYLLVSSFLGAAFLLHFALSFPKESRIVKRKSLIRFLYAPVVLAMLVAAIYLVSPLESSLRAASEELFIVSHTVVSDLFAILALAIFVSHIVRAGLTTTQKKYVTLMVGGMLTAWLPYIVASAVGTDTDPWNLTVVALPISFAVAFFGIDKARVPGESSPGRFPHF